MAGCAGLEPNHHRSCFGSLSDLHPLSGHTYLQGSHRDHPIIRTHTHIAGGLASGSLLTSCTIHRESVGEKNPCSAFVTVGDLRKFGLVEESNPSHSEPAMNLQVFQPCAFHIEGNH